MNHLLADDSHEISRLIFLPKIKKDTTILSSSAVMIGALKVKMLGIEQITCAYSENSDEPAPLTTLIRVFTVHMEQS